MAEIEHFCDPADKAHPKFAQVRDTQMLLYSACDQMDGKPAKIISIGEAVDTVNILQYFIYIAHLLKNNIKIFITLKYIEIFKIY
jgi:glycyl-tRNA synthetase (class II)